jgi:hypothetical protein
MGVMAVDWPRSSEFPRARLRPAAGARSLQQILGILAALFCALAWLLQTWLLGPALLCLLALFAVWKGSARGGVGLRVGRTGIVIGGVLQLPRKALRRALVVEEEGQTTVVLQSHLLHLIDVADRAEGNAILRALGMTPATSTTEFSFDSPLAQRISSPAFWIFLFLPALAIPLGQGLMLWPVLLLLLPWYAVLFLLAIPRKLRIGLDGVTIRWLWQRRFFPYREIRTVRQEDTSLWLELAGGQRIELSARWLAQRWDTGQFKEVVGFGSRKAYLTTVFCFLQEVCQSRASSAGGEVLLLPPPGRRLADWLGDLRAVLRPRHQDFRSDAGSDPELYWEMLEDPRVPSLQRAAAAVALGPTLDRRGQERLRVASEAVADPGLRAALDASSSEDDEALLRALEAISPRRPPRVRGPS